MKLLAMLGMLAVVVACGGEVVEREVTVVVEREVTILVGGLGVGSSGGELLERDGIEFLGFQYPEDQDSWYRCDGRFKDSGLRVGDADEYAYQLHFFDENPEYSERHWANKRPLVTHFDGLKVADVLAADVGDVVDGGDGFRLYGLGIEYAAYVGLDRDRVLVGCRGVHEIRFFRWRDSRTVPVTFPD